MTDTTTPTPAPAADIPAHGFRGLWTRMPRELLYLLTWFPVSLTAFGVSVGLFSAGLGTIVTFFIGLVLIVAVLYVARGFGTVQAAYLGWAARRDIPRPDWMDDRARTGFLGWVRACLGNGHYWLYLLHVLVVDIVVTTVSWAVTVTWVSVALGGLTFWIWDLLWPIAGGVPVSEWIAAAFGSTLTVDGRVLDAVATVALGVIFALTLPLVTRGLTLLNWYVARGLLGAWRSDALQRELVQSRGAASSAEGQALRRLERDIHDGPQQRLVRLQMDIAAAERAMAVDPDKARSLLAEAQQQSRDALEELRALSRGFAPPILLDRGLVAALQSAIARSTVPARLVDEIPADAALPQEIERNAYFAASEALANAAKHSNATDIEVRVSLADDGRWLEVHVADNGDGGAAAQPGHGLAGLDDRMRGLGGRLEVSSPDGGPTLVSAYLPLPR